MHSKFHGNLWDNKSSLQSDHVPTIILILREKNKMNIILRSTSLLTPTARTVILSTVPWHPSPANHQNGFRSRTQYHHNSLYTCLRHKINATVLVALILPLAFETASHNVLHSSPTLFKMPSVEAWQLSIPTNGIQMVSHTIDFATKTDVSLA